MATMPAAISTIRAVTSVISRLGGSGKRDAFESLEVVLYLLPTVLAGWFIECPFKTFELKVVFRQEESPGLGE